MKNVNKKRLPYLKCVKQSSEHLEEIAFLHGDSYFLNRIDLFSSISNPRRMLSCIIRHVCCKTNADIS